MTKRVSKTHKNILLVSGRSITRHGAQTSLLNIIRQSPPECSFTWYCPGREEKVFAEEVRQEGVTVVTGGLDLFKCSQKEQYRTIIHDIWRLCHENQYDIIHVNTGVIKFQAVVLLIGTLNRVPIRIAHSRSCIPADRSKLFRRFKRQALHSIVLCSATKLAACSYKAAESMFGPQNAKNAMIFPNSLDTKKYSFSRDTRHLCRKALALEDTLVFGHVGVMNHVKNHRFLIEVFRNISKQNEYARLLLVGDGILEKEIRQQIDQYDLTEKVIFTGYTDQVSEYLCAMDIFVFPSLYEGLGNVCIEAQTSGLPCVVSNRVPPEAQISDDLIFLPLEAGPEFWADRLLNVSLQSDEKRAAAWETVRDSRYDLHCLREYVEQLYG